MQMPRNTVHTPHVTAVCDHQTDTFHTQRRYHRPSPAAGPASLPRNTPGNAHPGFRQDTGGVHLSRARVDQRVRVTGAGVVHFRQRWGCPLFGRGASGKAVHGNRVICSQREHKGDGNNLKVYTKAHTCLARDVALYVRVVSEIDSIRSKNGFQSADVCSCFPTYYFRQLVHSDLNNRSPTTRACVFPTDRNDEPLPRLLHGVACDAAPLHRRDGRGVGPVCVHAVYLWQPTSGPRHDLLCRLRDVSTSNRRRL